MTRSRLAASVVILVTAVRLPAQTTPFIGPHHEANFDSERREADDLFRAQKLLESLPLYEDLCRQDPTIAVFAERHGADLLMKQGTLLDKNEQFKVHQEAIAELQRAQKLGDNTDYVRNVLAAESKTFIGAVVSGIPLSVGYTYPGTPDAQAALQKAEAAFGHSDWATAAQLYEQAAALDPKWYNAALFAGDSYFHLRDTAHAAAWFDKAIDIDPARETAYRYWGDALFQSGDITGARDKFIAAVVAEPYSQLSESELKQWAKRTNHQIVQPAIKRPEFITPNSQLQIDPTLAASTQDGRASWIVYQQYRVAHGARVLNQFIVGGGSDINAVVTPSGYEHTIAEEHAALRAMLADIDTNLKAGTLQEANLDPSIRNLRLLEKANVLGAWIALSAADAGIRQDYPKYRAQHRQHLIDYVSTYLIRSAPVAATAPQTP